MNLKRCVVAAALALALGSPARAGLVLSGSGDLNWNGVVASPTFTVGVSDPNGEITANNQLWAWSLGLEIQRVSGSGSLEFATATLPLSNYLLAGNSGGLSIPNTTFPSTTVLPAGDSANAGLSSIPAGSNLLALTFSITSGTSGVFDIVATGDPTVGSYYFTSADGINFNQFPFAGVPLDGSQTQTLGQVTVTAPASVPEPCAALLMASGALGLLLYQRAKAARRRL